MFMTNFVGSARGNYPMASHTIFARADCSACASKPKRPEEIVLVCCLYQPRDSGICYGGGGGGGGSPEGGNVCEAV